MKIIDHRVYRTPRWQSAQEFWHATTQRKTEGGDVVLDIKALKRDSGDTPAHWGELSQAHRHGAGARSGSREGLVQGGEHVHQHYKDLALALHHIRTVETTCQHEQLRVGDEVHLCVKVRRKYGDFETRRRGQITAALDGVVTHPPPPSD